MQTIKEEEEHEQEANELTMEMIALGMTPGQSPKKVKQNAAQSLQIGSRKGSFVGGSSFETSFVNETEADRSEREKKELAENFRVMTNDEYKD